MTTTSSGQNNRAGFWIFVVVVGLLLAAVVFAVLRTADEDVFSPESSESPVLDMLGWIPASDESQRAYAAWSAVPGDPLSLTDAIDTLGITPAPFALGRSSDWQQVTGISASDVTGWASAPGVGIAVLDGQFDVLAITQALTAAGYRESKAGSVPVWEAPDGIARPFVVAGDDLRALRALAVFSDRIVTGLTPEAIGNALASADGTIESLADTEETQHLVLLDTTGLMVLDQRDLAIDCGLGGGWKSGDFPGPSGFAVTITWRRGSDPVTTVGIEYPDGESARAGLTILEDKWFTGFLNQRGMGAPVSDMAKPGSVYVDGSFVVAELVRGRDNGWTRSGVRFLIESCEHASRLIPVNPPPQASPIASPQPVE